MRCSCRHQGRNEGEGLGRRARREGRRHRPRPRPTTASRSPRSRPKAGARHGQGPQGALTRSSARSSPLGDIDSVKARSTPTARPGLATDEQFKAASATLTGDRLAFAYVDNAALRTATQDLVGAVASDAPTLPTVFDKWMAPWTAVAVRAKDSAFLVESRSPHVDGAPAREEQRVQAPVARPGLRPSPSPRATMWASRSPGSRSSRLRPAVRRRPQAGRGHARAGRRPRRDHRLDGRGRVAVTADGDLDRRRRRRDPDRRRAAADRLFDQLKAFIQLAGGSQGLKRHRGGLRRHDDHDPRPGRPRRHARRVGGPARLRPGDLQIAYAVTDEVVALGTPDFVKGVLDARSGASLAGLRPLLGRPRPRGQEPLGARLGGRQGHPRLRRDPREGHARRGLRHRRSSRTCRPSTASSGPPCPATTSTTEPSSSASAQTDESPQPNSDGPGPTGPSNGGATHPMAVRIRLTRVGATKQPSYRVVVADSRSARDGRAIDTIGHYNPRTDPDRARRRRGQGQGLARQGRPAVRHGPPPVQAGRRDPGRPVASDGRRRPRRVRRQVPRR